MTTVANQIKSGQIEIGLAIGVESMSLKYEVSHIPRHSLSCLSSANGGVPSASEEILACQPSRDNLMPMGWTSESITSDHNISREDMDAFAAASFQRAEAAVDAGKFSDEIVPFSALVSYPNGSNQTITVSHDEGLRRGTTPQALAKLRPAFSQWSPGYTTGGNASQVTDGVAAVILMRRDKAEALGLEILGKWVTTRIAGSERKKHLGCLLTLSD